MKRPGQRAKLPGQMGDNLCEHTTPCPNGTIVLLHDRATLLVPKMCGRWKCQTCGPRKARRLRARLVLSSPTRLITLTLRADPNVPAAEQLHKANRAWSILWRRYRRQFGERAVGYAKIVELTKAGTPHLHIIANVPYIHHTALSAAWRELTGSFIVDIRKVDDRRGVAGYLSNYLTKALDVPTGMRKWSAARGFVPPAPLRELEPDEIAPVASFQPVSADNLARTYLERGYRSVDGWLYPPEYAFP